MEKEEYFTPESKKKSPVNLSALTFNFCTDEQIKSFYDQKLHLVNHTIYLEDFDLEVIYVQ